MRFSSAKSSNSGIESRETSENQDSEQFKWIDDEIQLLLAVTKEYKAKQAAQNLDWLNIRNRYDYITERFKEQFLLSLGERLTYTKWRYLQEID